MDVCPECGINVKMLGGHSPFCSLNLDVADSQNLNEYLAKAKQSHDAIVNRHKEGVSDEVSARMDALTASILGRTEQFFRQAYNAVREKEPGIMSELEFNDAIDSALATAGIAISMTFSVLIEQELLNTEAFDKFLSGE